METSYAAYWPRAPRALSTRPTAPRLDSLAGQKIAFLWDYLFRGDEVFAILKRELSARFPGIAFVGPDEFGSTHGSDEREVMAALPAKLSEHKVTAVISGMGC
jgi:hypothetical protein